MLALIAEYLGILGFSSTISLFLASITVMFFIALVSFIINIFANRFLLKSIGYIVKKTHSTWGKSFIKHNVFKRLSHVAPAIVVGALAPMLNIPGWPFSQNLVQILEKLALLYIIFVVVSSLNALLDSINEVYIRKPVAKTRPIKSYLQVVKILLAAVALITAIIILTGESPAIFLTGLGAMTAILALTFKDTILSFVASIQLSAYDIVRIGDWIEVPKYGANGDVVDMSLNTIKVQNFDKTIVTIPTYAMMAEGVKNWRGMQHAGGRRIKRAINIDMQSIKFCDDKLLARLREINYLHDYIEAKTEEITLYNESHKAKPDNLANGRRMTNIGLFRAYIHRYLMENPKVHSSNFTFLIRQLDPTATGLPLQIYVFANDTNWANYEAIQADIFDHILAVMSEFDLRVFQNVSDHSVVEAVEYLPQTLAKR